ncbi:MAG TPA: WG repeat-containing protein, partial [Mobilitalea sp.]|nr:WG repeat-containing protein [Mobilitalea sp.]
QLPDDNDVTLPPIQSVTMPPVQENSDSNVMLYPAYETTKAGKKYGYIDSLGEFVLPAIYNYATVFSDGVAIISIEDSYQIINTKGDILFENDYFINEFSNGAAVFHKVTDSKLLYGYINTAGEVILEPQYSEAGNFGEDNTAIVCSESGVYSQIDKSGKIIKELNIEEYYGINLFRDGYLVFTNYENYGQGVKDLQGKVIFEPIYSEIYNLGKGLFAIRQQGEDNYTPALEPMAIFNKEGEQLSDYIYYEVNEYQGDMASASDRQYTFFIDTDGKPMEEFPKVEGIGNLRLIDDMIQANVDKDFFYLTKDGTIIWKMEHLDWLTDNITAKRLRYRPNRFALISYPELQGLDNQDVQTLINQKVRKIFRRDPNSINEDDAIYIDDDYYIELSNNLLTVYRDGYDYPYGAAHGMPIRDYYYFDITTGEQYELGDLFIDDSLYISKLNLILDKMIIDSAQNPDSMIFTDFFTGISDNQYFILTEDSVIIYFYPYDIAAYAAGFPEFNIPYTDLSDIINTEGSLWNSFEHNTLDKTSNNSDTTLTNLMDSVIKLYEKSMVSAININYFDYVEPHLLKESSLYKSQKELVKSLSDRDIREEYISSKVEKVEYDRPNNQYLVYTEEIISIDYPDQGKVIKTFYYIYTVVASDIGYRLQLSDIKTWER